MLLLEVLNNYDDVIPPKNAHIAEVFFDTLNTLIDP